MKSLNFLAVVAASSVWLSAADWSNYRGPSHDGKSVEQMIGVWPANPQPLWKIATPNGFSSFAVKGGRAYTLVGRAVDGVQREALIALDAATGRELWSVPFGAMNYGHGGGNAGTRNNSGGDGPRSTPTIDEDRIYVLTSDLLLACFDLNGKEVWNRDILREHNGRNITWKNAASPVIEGNLVFAAGGGNNEALLAFNKATGEVVWKGESDRMTHATPVPATIHGVRQIVFLTQTGLVSVQPADGKVLWRQRFPFQTSTGASPVVAGDVVYCSAGYGVGSAAYRISRQGGAFSSAELWRSRGNKIANHWSTPVHQDGYLYGMFSFKEYGDGPLKCIDIRTGEEKWSENGFGQGNLIMVNGDLVALTDAGEVVRLEAIPAGYKEQARFKAVAGKCWSTPAFSAGKLYIRGTKEAAAFDLSVKVAGH